MSDEARQTRLYTYAIVIMVAAAVAFARITTVSGVYVPALGNRAQPPQYSPIQSQNDLSRWCMVWSLVERGTFQIDEISQNPGWSTIDRVQKDGHLYSSKPPLLGVLIAGLYWLLKQGAGWTLLSDTHAVVQTILLLVNWMPFVISLITVADIAERWANATWTRLYLVVSMAAATFLTTFVATLNNHTIAAWSVTFSIWATLRILDGSRHPLYFILAGFFSAFAAANELPAILYTLGLHLILGRVCFRRMFLFSISAAAIPLAAFWITNAVETGGLLPFYAFFGTSYYNATTNDQPTYWAHPQGIDRGLDSMPIYLLHMTLGHHGILSLTPMFLLTVMGWFMLSRDEARRLRSVIVFTLILTLAILEFYLFRTENYNYGGVTSGLRWTFWLIPLWSIGMIPVLDRWGENRWFRCLTIAMLGASVFSAAWANKNPWQHPWLFELFESWGWTHYRS